MPREIHAHPNPRKAGFRRRLLHTNASGKFTVTSPDAGRYLLLVRHRDMAPSGAAAHYYSYSFTLAAM
ncbi:hypothetical protein [Sphingobium ummariense]